jgi:4-hydroxy-tetrahydrodipicolinate synthase
MPRPIAGVLPIAHTPLLESDTIDDASLRRQVDWAFQHGANGCCTGMVSELLRLTTDERVELVRKLVEFAAARGAVVASVGAESTKQALRFAREAEQAGCDALMAIPPVATALPEPEVWDYFQALAESSDLPLIVQDASGYVGRPLDFGLYVRLLERYGPEKILFKPEASPPGPVISALIRQSGGRAVVFDGSGGILLVDAYRRGVRGCMPGMELLDGIAALWQALQQGDDDAIYRLYFPICAIAALQMQAGLDGFLAIEKHILVKRGVFTSARRRKPYAWQLDDETAAELDRLLIRYDAALGRKAAIQT